MHFSKFQNAARKLGGSIFTVVPPISGSVDSSKCTVGVSASTVVSGSLITVTLTLKDANNVQLTSAAGLTIVPTKSGGSATGTLSSVTDVGNGTLTWTYTGVLKGTAQTLGCTINDVTVTSTLPTCSVTVGAIDRTVSVVTVSATSRINGGAVIICTLQAKDAAGNNLTTGGSTIVISSSGGTSTGTFGATTDVGNGTYTRTFTPTGPALGDGTATTLTATIGGQSVTTTMPTIVVRGASLSLSTVTLASSSAAAGGSNVTVTLTAKDSTGTQMPSGGLTALFDHSGGTAVISIGSVTDNNNGTYTASITPTTEGTATTLSATLNSSTVTSSMPTFTVTAAFDYYLATTGSDGNNGTSPSTPFRTWGKMWSVVTAGKTVQVADGSYTSADPSVEKAGTSGSPIVVSAANDGGAVITDGLDLRGNAYLTFRGFKITGVSAAVTLVSNGVGKPTHHCIFQRIGFQATDTTLNNNAAFDLSDGTHHCLLEDCWGWGGGRYVVMAYGGPGGSPPNTTCDYNTFRRLVLRMGPSTSTSGNPQAALALYYASHNIVENCIAINGRPASDSSNAGFYLTGHAPPPNTDDNKFYGCLVVDHDGYGWYVDESGAVANDNVLVDCVAWDCASGGFTTGGGTINPFTLDHCTGGANTLDGFEFFASTVVMTNNVFKGNGGFGAKKSSSTLSVNDHNGYFGNASGARSGFSAGTGDLTSDPVLSYIARIEAGSPYKNAGSSGDIGANVVNRYVDGALTGDALWPWPYEARIHADMAADDNRGFAAVGETLTHYVWNYLGNGSPY